MLGRKDFTPEELQTATTFVDEQLAAWQALAEAAEGSAQAALRALEPQHFNALDRLFVHRIRAVSGKDGNPLNELELIAESLIDHGGAFTLNKVIMHVPDQSVLGLRAGDPIELGAAQFERLARAFLAELGARFVPARV